MKHRRTESALSLFAVICAAVVVLTGCDGGHHHYYPYGDIDGYASFPYEDEWGNYPVYYETGNDLILVTLYDADDVLYEFPLRDFLTDTSGYYSFLGVDPGWYFLTTEAQECDLDFNVTDYYWAESEDFYVEADELYILDLFLEYDGSEPGCTLGAQILKEMAQEAAPGELDWTPPLEEYHKLRLERFQRGGPKGKAAKSRLNMKTEESRDNDMSESSVEE